MFYDNNFHYFDWRFLNTFKNTFYWLYRRQQLFLFYKGRCAANVLLKLSYLQTR